MINRYVSKIRRIFVWGVGEEIVKSTVSDALEAVKDLRKGEEGTRDNPPREAVPEWVIAATLPFLPLVPVEQHWCNTAFNADAFYNKIKANGGEGVMMRTPTGTYNPNNRLLRCFVIIEIKTHKLTHEDLGQLQMYVNYIDRFEKLPDESPTVGILLCTAKNELLAKITLPGGQYAYPDE